MKTNDTRQDRGSALVVTLAILVIVIILAVGMAESVRLNRTSSNLYAERSRATLFSEEALEQVIAKLLKNTGDRERHWISQPGQLIVGGEAEDGNPDNGDERKTLDNAKSPLENPNPAPTEARIVWLHSGIANTVSFPGKEFLDPPNLNVLTFQDPTTHVITDREDPENPGRAIPMRVRWNYIRKDGSIDIDPVTGLPSEVPDLTNRDNPIVGRFAYFADDESAKVNYNLAWTRSSVNTTPVGDPSRVSLSALHNFSEALANSLRFFITPDNFQTIRRFFNTPEDARQVSDEVARALIENKFEVTHYSHDPDTTFFNEPRIVLTTNPERAGWKWNAAKNAWEGGRPYLRVLKGDERDDPGLVSSLDAARVNETLFGPGGTAGDPKYPGLVYYLSRKDWPFVKGNGSLQSKYFGGSTRDLVQFAVCIIDYVRSAESNQPIVEALRGRLKVDLDVERRHFAAEALDTFVATFKYSGVRGIAGLTRAPMITEMAAVVSSTTSEVKMFLEVYLPEHYGIPSVNLLSLEYTFQVSRENRTRIGEEVGTSVKADEIIGGKTRLYPGERAIITKVLKYKKDVEEREKETDLAPGTKVALRGALHLRGRGAFDLAPVDDYVVGAYSVVEPEGAFYTLPEWVDFTKDGPLPERSLQTDDPRVNGIGPDWKEKDATWGKPNPIDPPNPSISPPQDTDASGNLYTRLHMPAPKGSEANPHGMVASAGELGFVHTGIRMASHLNDGSTAPPGVPWRTIRLQPSTDPDDVVPDWAFMDLFTPPIIVPEKAKSVFTPHNMATAGRVNMNARVEPFNMERTLPLAAALQNARKDTTNPESKVSPEEARTIAQNIYNRVLAAKGKHFGYKDGFDSPGEIVEIKGVADGGEASEELVRQLSNVITSRGNVFSVYTIGQAVKQTPGGKLVVTAEHRHQTFVERRVDPLTGEVTIRAVYSRPMSP